MKRVWILSFVICVFAVSYVVYKDSKYAVYPPDSETAWSLSDTGSQPVKKIVTAERPPNTSLNQSHSNAELDHIDSRSKLCKDYQHGVGIDSIHRTIVAELEREIRRGTAVRELLAYNEQYDTYYKSFDDLVWQARVNVENKRYTITSSIDILKQWPAVTKIMGLSDETRDWFISKLAKNSAGEGIPFVPQALAKKEDVFALLYNHNSFNTYLEGRFLSFGSSAISPSIFFVANSQSLTLEEYQAAVKEQHFTVNDIGVAIKRHVPADYIALLIDQTPLLDSMPVFIKDNDAPFNNLADIAVSEYQLDTLKLLVAQGVFPSNEPGIITALDLALVNIPATSSQDDKYVATLKYLISLGLHAHAIRSGGATTFKAPGRRVVFDDKFSSKDLRDIVGKIELIDSNRQITQRLADDSPLSLVISKAKKLQSKNEIFGQQCAITTDE